MTVIGGLLVGRDAHEAPDPAPDPPEAGTRFRVIGSAELGHGAQSRRGVRRSGSRSVAPPARGRGGRERTRAAGARRAARRASARPRWSARRRRAAGGRSVGARAPTRSGRPRSGRGPPPCAACWTRPARWSPRTGPSWRACSPSCPGRPPVRHRSRRPSRARRCRPARAARAGHGARRGRPGRHRGGPAAAVRRGRALPGAARLPGARVRRARRPAVGRRLDVGPAAVRGAALPPGAAGDRRRVPARRAGRARECSSSSPPAPTPCGCPG